MQPNIIALTDPRRVGARTARGLAILATVTAFAGSVAAQPQFSLLRDLPTDHPYRDLASPVGRLDITKSDMSRTSCTAFIISDTYIMTSAHCVPGDFVGSGRFGEFEASPRAVDATLVMGLTSRDGVGARRYDVDTIAVESSRILDFSVLRVGGNPAIEWGAVELTLQYVPIDAPGVIFHHANGAPMQITEENCALLSPSPIAEDASILTEGGQDARALAIAVGFDTSCAITGGSSGAPYYSLPEQRVFGVMSATSNAHDLSRAIPVTMIAIASQIVRDLATGATPVFGGDTGNILFGDDIGLSARDGICDDPRFVGPGMAARFIERQEVEEGLMTLISTGHDASDCHAQFEDGRIAIRLDRFGDDSGPTANDGRCDDPLFKSIQPAPGAAIGEVPAGSNIYSAAALQADASDCRTLFEAGEVALR